MGCDFRRGERFSESFCPLAVAMLTYAGGWRLYGRVAQMEASRRFDQDLIATSHSDLAEGDLVGRLEVPRLGISVALREQRAPVWL